jgi:hypothetical protein
MTETQNIPTAACGEHAGHKAHRFFDLDMASRPCSGMAVETDTWVDPERDDEGPSFFGANGDLVNQGPQVDHNRPERQAARYPLDRPLIDATEQAGAPAPTLADDVAALRAEVEAYWRDGQLPNYMTILFDRIAGAVPQRATERGDQIWQHSCGRADSGEADMPPRYCSTGYGRCTTDERTGWVRLYTLPGGE